MHKPDQALNERVFAQLRKVIQELGQNGGSMTPSVYETAQVLRFCPEIVEVDKVVDWLLRQQQADGGWGDPAKPLYRDMPTHAALLALLDYRQHPRVRCATTTAQRFLEEQSKVIEPTDGEHLPVAIELILPRLLDEAEEMGILLSRSRFQHLEELGARKHKLFAQHPPQPDSAAVFSWEAWGVSPDLDLVSYGGVGHNPAATAWWLNLDRGRASTAARQRALDGIRQASHASKVDIIGVVPDAWPLDRFEQSFALHFILIAGLLAEDNLVDVLAPQLEDLRLAFTADGIGFNDYFAPDGDDTAAALVVLASAGLPVDCAVLTPFERADHFVTYPFETHNSFTVTARATQALRVAGYNADQWRQTIIKAQQPDGWWMSDKWGSSRLYGTCIALAALDEGACATKTAAAHAFIKYQHEDGGWGCSGRSTLVETAFGVLGLSKIMQESGCEAECMIAMNAANRYLRHMYNKRKIGTEHTWICKDLFSARRIDHAAILCALLISDLV